jgi:hypothetical protein
MAVVSVKPLEVRKEMLLEKRLEIAWAFAVAVVLAKPFEVWKEILLEKRLEIVME